MGAVEFDLPWPPSVNNYYRHVGPRVLISRAGRKYRTMVVSRLAGSHKLAGRLSLSLECYPPDRRRRDLDNLLKACQDALVQAGVMEDDSQIRRLQMEMLEPIEGGLVHVRLETLPERRGQSRVRPPSE
ncbi:MAG: RusA family crossover junction endodeoxyribonuclease [Kiritimatiellia bacterium]